MFLLEYNEMQIRVNLNIYIYLSNLDSLWKNKKYISLIATVHYELIDT